MYVSRPSRFALIVQCFRQQPITSLSYARGLRRPINDNCCLLLLHEIVAVGMVNKQADPVPEFTMQSEDFPALPGSNIMNKSTGTNLPFSLLHSSSFGRGVKLLVPCVVYM